MDDCYCEDFEAVEGDLLGLECLCGHADFEHSPGFFMRCDFNTQDDEL